MNELIRPATRDDAEAMNTLYNPLIVDNHVSFAYEPFTLESRLAWWDARAPELPALVLEVDGAVVGMSFASRFRPKEAYNSSPETTIVLDESVHGRGCATRLLGALVEELVDRGFHRAEALISLPNDASVALHSKLGYRTVGTMSEVGFKMGRYWDAILMEKDL
jgi:phosphinothricin acetyltransferase